MRLGKTVAALRLLRGFRNQTMTTMLNKTILLLGSHPISRSVVKEVLENAGYSVFPAGDLGEAVDSLQKAIPDLLIVRAYIEDIPGYDAATFLRTKSPGLRVLMVSGLIDDDRVQYRMDLEGFEVFPKPFTATELLEKVKDMLAQPSVRESRQINK
jgi:DNA-binding response OmpR family regulator